MTDRGALGVLAASGSIGAVLGATRMATWQALLESAQAIAGIVPYDPANAFYQYHMRAWSITHHFAAAALVAGVDEYTLSRVISAGLGFLSFAGLALIAYAISKRRVAAIAAPLLVFGLFAGGRYYDLVYPVWMMGTHHTYGVMARGYMVLTLGCFAVGWKRTAMVMLGLAPAVHPTWGMFFFFAAVIALLWDGWATKANLRTLGPWFAAGVVLSAASLAVQWGLARGLPSATGDDQTRYLEAFLEFWDGHRMPAPVDQPAMLLAALSIPVAMAALQFFKNDLTEGGRLALKLLTVCAGLGILGVAASHVSEYLPHAVQMLMPARFINLAAFAYPALLTGLLALRATKVGGRVLLFAHLAYIPWVWFFTAYLRSDRFGWELRHWREFVLMTLALFAWEAYGRFSPENSWDARTARLQRPLMATTLVVLLVGVFTFAHTGRLSSEPLYTVDSRPALAAAREAEGLLITSGAMQLVQLQTRRPLLMNTGALDQIAYVPGSGPALEDALNAVYGVSLFAPPPDVELHRAGGLMRDTEKRVWEDRARDEWETIGARYGATQVLTYADRTLDLPLVVKDDEYALFRIPVAAPADNTL